MDAKTRRIPMGISGYLVTTSAEDEQTMADKAARQLEARGVDLCGPDAGLVVAQEVQRQAADVATLTFTPEQAVLYASGHGHNHWEGGNPSCPACEFWRRMKGTEGGS